VISIRKLLLDAQSRCRSECSSPLDRLDIQLNFGVCALRLQIELCSSLRVVFEGGGADRYFFYVQFVRKACFLGCVCASIGLWAIEFRGKEFGLLQLQNGPKKYLSCDEMKYPNQFLILYCPCSDYHLTHMDCCCSARVAYNWEPSHTIWVHTLWYGKVKLTSVGFGKCTLVLDFKWMVEGLNLVARFLFLTQNCSMKNLFSFFMFFV
jgi:hypothetical protein